MCTTFLYDTCNQINQKRGGSGNFFLVWNIANSMLEERVPLLHFGASFGIGGMYMFILFISYSFKIPVLDSVAGSVILYVNLSQFIFFNSYIKYNSCQTLIKRGTGIQCFLLKLFAKNVAILKHFYVQMLFNI